MADPEESKFEEAKFQREMVAREEAAEPVLEALWRAVLNDWELWQRLEAAAGGDVLGALSTAKGCLIGSLCRRRYELGRLERDEAGA